MKVCIFNTASATDSAGNPFQSVVPIPPDLPFRTKPVRLLNADKCALEFIFTGAPGPFLLYWWTEFWGDDVRASLQAPPSLRNIPGINPNTPWSREVLQEVDAGYLVCNYLIRKTVLDGALGSALWVPIDVFAPWMQLAVYTEAPGLNGGDLLINAHVGGHIEDKFLVQNGDKPYVYNA